MGFGGIQLTRPNSNGPVKDEFLVFSVVPFSWMILLIGGIIILTLSYVSWRKYRGQKRRGSRRK